MMKDKDIPGPVRPGACCRIELNGMRFHAYHGCFGFERELGGEYVVDFSAFQDSSSRGCGGVDMLAATVSDDLGDTLDYSSVYGIVSEVMRSPSNLIEKVAGDIMAALAERYPGLGEVRIAVKKLAPPIDGMDAGGYACFTLTSRI